MPVLCRIMSTDDCCASLARHTPVALLSSQLRWSAACDIFSCQQAARTALQEHLAGLPRALDGGPVQRGAAVLVGQVQARIHDKQKAHRVRHTLVGGPVGVGQGIMSAAGAVP